MGRYDNNNRLTPEAIVNYDLKPAASVVDKQSKYTPQLEDSTKLKQTAQGLADLADGVTAINIQMARMAAKHTPEAYLKTEEENKAKFAEVSKNIKGFAKFNPYNREVYNTLRANTIVGNAQLKYKELAVNCEQLTPVAFDEQVATIQEEMLAGLKAEGIKAKNSANALEGFQAAQGTLKNLYITKKAERDMQVTHNAMVNATSHTFATNAYNKDISYLDGWNDSVKRLVDTANGLGINNEKQYELFLRSVNQYLTNNIDDIDAEEFMIALGQTTINGQPLSNFDPNYATTTKQLLVKAKSAKYELDKLDLDMEKLRLSKLQLAANAELFATAAKGDGEETLNKAYEIIDKYGMESIGLDFIHDVVKDKNALYALQTVQHLCRHIAALGWGENLKG